MSGFNQNIKAYLTELFVEEALEYPDYDNDGIARKEKIEKLLNIQNMRKQFFLKRNKNVTFRYYCLNPKEYNECDTLLGKEYFSVFEDDEPFIEEIHIDKNGKLRITRKKIPGKKTLEYN